MTFLKSKSSSRIQNHKKNVQEYFSCVELELYDHYKTLYCIVVDGFLNGRVQAGQVILRIKNMSG